MKESQDYLNASETDKAAMEYERGTAYDEWINSLKTGAFWEHFDKWMETLGLSSVTSGNSGGKNKPDLNDQLKQLGETAAKLTGRTVADLLEIERRFGLYAGQQFNAGTTNANGIPGNASGGLVDYTGLAWVDGSITKPEAFLSAADTELMRNMLDAASYLAYRPTISNIDSNAFGKGGINIGDVNITITEASFKEDADYERVAERVGAAFVKELGKQGFNTANYAF